ncbi:DUF3999 domain-containing protein [Luteimonas sp. Y-2-2-4F]|nr:DUF3999 domain-containing protein [Luteimonas sp. Y-2-2-4F]MCD9033754.1 DUF3999 domain-containing protein [Luteimonas sp. Y-2-2-4F]
MIRPACACLLFAMAVARAAAADPRAAFAAQWPLELSAADAGAYRVELTEAIYARAGSPALADVVVVNGEGREVPSLLAPAQAPRAGAPVLHALPWFPLPAGRAPRDIAAISEIDAAGRLRRVELRGEGGRAGEAVPGEVLVDASALEAPARALHLDWDGSQPPFEQVLRIEASDDLRQWRIVQPEARVLDLQRGGERLAERRIGLSAPVRARYFRLVPLRPAAAPLRLDAVRAEVAAAAPEATWRWRRLAPRRVEAEGREVFEYRLDGRFPVERVDLALAGNATNTWRLAARDSGEAPWHDATGAWVGYRLATGDVVERSPPQALAAPTRVRDWRLAPGTPVPGTPPDLLLGYRPEALVFVAEGPPPYALLAGSARGVRADAPVAPLLDALRAQRGDGWAPAAAMPGAMAVLAGDAALLPAEAPRDWRTWALWGVLLLGVAVVAGFALSLLRRAPSP